MRTTCIANNETRQWESVLDQILCILLWRLEQRSEVFVALLILVACLSPFRHGLTVKDENVEKGVEEEDGF